MYAQNTKSTKMKKAYLFGLMLSILLFSCNSTQDKEANTEALNEQLTSSTNIKEASKSFAQGGATNSEEYFSGLLSSVVEIDVKLREIVRLDETDAAVNKINAVLDTTLSKIEQGRKAIKLYQNEDWPKRAEFHEITEEWYTAVEGLINDHYRQLAEPMSRDMNTWTAEEMQAYEAYLDAFDLYLDIDNRWIDFQDVYAEANEFILEGTINEEAMLEEELISNE